MQRDAWERGGDDLVHISWTLRRFPGPIMQLAGNPRPPKSLGTLRILRELRAPEPDRVRSRPFQKMWVLTLKNICDAPRRPTASPFDPGNRAACQDWVVYCSPSGTTLLFVWLCGPLVPPGNWPAIMVCASFCTFSASAADAIFCEFTSFSARCVSSKSAK